MAEVPRSVRKPVIIIGAGRSGTTILAEILSIHPDVAYWSEPRPIWMYGHAYRRHHVLGRDDLTPRIARYIDRRFGEFLARSGRSRFMEKTPSNCLRIPFIHSLYPDCKIVNMIRDGRRAIRAIVEIGGRVPNKNSVSTRLRETPLWEWPAYVPMFFNTVWRTNFLGKRSRYWGAQPPGWKRYVSEAPHVAAAWQWKTLVSVSIEQGRMLPAGSYKEVRFEELMKDAEEVVRGVMQFAELEDSVEVRQETRSRINPAAVRKWSQTLTPSQQEEANRIMEPVLVELGYVPPGNRSAP